jgi:XTP/dITP diphosphohydrolase
MRKLVIATANSGKLKEFRELLAGLPLEISSLADYPDIGPIAETGSSFAENAIIKAETTAAFTGEISLADDSGLEVDALGGRPGIYSARYAGPGAGDRANNEKLLQQLACLPEPERTARFRACIAITVPGLSSQLAEGACDGLITTLPRGEGGFGYDPLFLVPHLQKTFAELTPEEKNRISHRARAMEKARQILVQMLEN